MSKKLAALYWIFLLLPTLLFGLGFLSNAVVMAANHGQMPVLWPGGCPAHGFKNDIIHVCMTESTHLKVLADWIVIRSVGVASPGDFLEWFYELAFTPFLCGAILIGSIYVFKGEK